ncbi:hypothetical protein EG833_02570 [archaeon]|nr:hypothetical protein [archaeon]
MILAISNDTALHQTKAAGCISSGNFVGQILYDRKDTNRDGIVSYAEELEWAIRHPGEDVFGRSLSSVEAAGNGTTYNESGGLSSSTDSSQSHINLYI